MLWKKLVGAAGLVEPAAAGGVPVVEGFATTDSGGAQVTELALTAPAGITSGELLLIIVGSEDSGAADEFAAITDWTKVGEAGDTSSDAHIGLYWKAATGSEGAVTVTADSADAMFGFYIRISGADTTTPIDAYLDGSGSTASSHDILSITTTVADTLAIYALSFDGGDGDPFGQPTGWTEQGEATSGTLGSDNGSGVWGSKSMVSAGATGDATVSCSASDGAAYFQVAIAPA